MKLSIITINYNNKAGLEKTIASVMSQTWRDFEWLLIDGGSTDGSKEVIEELAKNPSANISYRCSEPDKGIYNAMNKGIAKAKGEYLLFMNSGDCLNTNAILEEVFSYNYTADILYGDIFLSIGDKRIFMPCPQKLELSYLYTSTIRHQASFIKRTLFDDYKYDESYKIVSDWKAWIDWWLKHATFEHINYTVSLVDGEGISCTQTENTNNERQRALNEIFTLEIKNYLDVGMDKWSVMQYRCCRQSRLFAYWIKINIKLVELVTRNIH